MNGSRRKSKSYLIKRGWEYWHTNLVRIILIDKKYENIESAIQVRWEDILEKVSKYKRGGPKIVQILPIEVPPPCL